MKEIIRVRVQYASRQQCCKTHKRPLPFTFLAIGMAHRFQTCWQEVKIDGKKIGCDENNRGSDLVGSKDRSITTYLVTHRASFSVGTGEKFIVDEVTGGKLPIPLCILYDWRG